MVARLGVPAGVTKVGNVDTPNVSSTCAMSSYLGNGVRLEVGKALGISTLLRSSTPVDEPTFYEVIPEEPIRLGSARSPPGRGCAGACGQRH